MPEPLVKTAQSWWLPCWGRSHLAVYKTFFHFSESQRALVENQEKLKFGVCDLEHELIKNLYKRKPEQERAQGRRGR